jgi:hypothetical protein
MAGQLLYVVGAGDPTQSVIILIALDAQIANASRQAGLDGPRYFDEDQILRRLGPAAAGRRCRSLAIASGAGRVGSAMRVA